MGKDKKGFDKQVGFSVGVVVLLCVVGPYIYYAIQINSYGIKNKPADYFFQDITDYWRVLVGAAVTQLFIALCHIVLHKPVMAIAKGSTVQDRETHTKKAIQCFANASYFFASFLWGYYVIKDAKWLPEWMGGEPEGGFKNWFVNAPFTHCPRPVLEYSLYTMGFHFGNLVTHFKDMQRTDFYEMLLHHIATTSLYFGFIFSNLMPVGATIAWLHDIADVPANLSKGLSSTRFENTTVAVFAVMMVLWTVTRLYWLPILIYNIYTNPIFSFPPECSQFNVYIILNGIFLSVLQALHIFWYCLFLVMLFNKITKGKVEDIQSRVPQHDANKIE